MNWKEIKTEYVTSDIGYRELAEKHSVSFSTLSKYAAKHQWPTYRKKYRDKVVTDAATKIGTKEVNRLAKVAEASDRLSRYIAKVTKETSLIERKEGKPDTKAIRDLASSLRDLTAVIRDVYELPSLRDRRAYEMAQKRLELDFSRTGIGDNEQEQTGVIVLADIMPEIPEPQNIEEIGDG